MLISNFKVQRHVAAIVLPITLICMLALLSFTRFFIANNYKLSIGITFDLAFSVPLLHFLLSKRHNNLKYTTALFFTAGILIAGIIIPKNDQFLLHGIKLWMVPIIEICGTLFFVVKIKNALASYAESEAIKNDFYTAFKGIATELLPHRLASIIAAEISAFYYGFFNWKKTVLDDNTYSYHKKGGVPALIGVFIFMILLEAAIFHLLLAKWSTKTAWVLSGVSVYAAIQAFGITRSIIKRPIRIIEDQLLIPYGILAETTLNLKNILSVQIAPKSIPTDENSKCLSPFKKIDEPNIVIYLNKPYHIEGIYGSKKTFETLFINVDESESFIAQVQLLIKSDTQAGKIQ